MNEAVKNYAKTHKVLTLQIAKESFVAIATKRQTFETRVCYPKNFSKYLDIAKEGGKEKFVPKEFDALYLINGKKVNAPKILVKVTSAEYVIEVDKDGKPLMVDWDNNGEKYIASYVQYNLGEILNVENYTNRK